MTILFLKQIHPVLFIHVLLLLDVELLLGTDYANVPAGSASLAFVFDTTGSMSDDVAQAKAGAAKILNTTLFMRDRPLYNYVLVPFNDPEIGPVLETTDPNKFLNMLNNITVDGGDDCPEMSIGAIYKAIDICLPQSFIYVFTDASAKDFNMTDSVIALNQHKSSRVVFWLTGYCGDPDSEGYKAYERISATSSGQTFVIQKSQVDEVLDSIRTDIHTDKVNLISAESTDDNSSFAVPVDSKLKDVTISVSGKKPNITLTDRFGKQITDTKTLLDIENALIVKVEHPPPGEMKVDVKTEGPHSVRVTGRSSKDFVVWILPKYLFTYNESEHLLLSGNSTYMYILVFVNGTDLLHSANFSKIELLNVDGTFITEYNLTRNETEFNTYRTMIFVPPLGYFYVKVIGTDESGYSLGRLMTTAIKGLQPTKPKISLQETFRGCLGSNIKLRCQIDSPIPYSVRWFRGDNQQGDEKFFELVYLTSFW